MAKHQIENWLEKIDPENSDCDWSDEENLEELLENVLENNDFLENIFDGTVSLFVFQILYYYYYLYIYI